MKAQKPTNGPPSLAEALGYDGESMAKTLLGRNAVHVAARLVVQDMGEHDGRPLMIVVGVLQGEDLRSAIAQAGAYPQELILGDLFLRPMQRYTGEDGVGKGAEGLLMEGIMPDFWTFQVSADGQHVIPSASDEAPK